MTVVSGFFERLLLLDNLPGPAGDFVGSAALPRFCQEDGVVRLDAKEYPDCFTFWTSKWTEARLPRKPLLPLPAVFTPFRFPGSRIGNVGIGRRELRVNDTAANLFITSESLSFLLASVTRHEGMCNLSLIHI